MPSVTQYQYYSDLVPSLPISTSKRSLTFLAPSSMSGAPSASRPGSDSLCDEFAKSALGPSTSPSWSDLPTDILITILHRLELPQALVFASVCTTWRAAAATAGIPRSCAPWIMSWGNRLEEMHVQKGRWSSAVTCNLYHPVDVDKSYGLSFPKGCFCVCCGASHGWLILANDISNLVLYNPATLAMIPLPPVTDFTFVEAIGGDYRLRDSMDRKAFYEYEANKLGLFFYEKAVLSCSPSKGGIYVVMIIHNNSALLSFVKAGQSKWQVVSNLGRSDSYLDCAYHKGRFYAVTLEGMVEKWDLDGENGPTREVLVAAKPHPGCVLSRHLVSTPWGDLLQVRAMLEFGYPDGVAFEIFKVTPDGCKKMEENVLVDHALFLGLNHSACLPIQNLPGIRSHCIYFSSPVIRHAFDFLLQLRVWGGARTYDLKRRRFECVFPFCDLKELMYGMFPSEVWITQNL